MNRIVYNYLKKNKDNYPLESLSQKAMSVGYSPEEVEEALAKIKEEEKGQEEKIGREKIKEEFRREETEKIPEEDSKKEVEKSFKIEASKDKNPESYFREKPVKVVTSSDLSLLNFGGYAGILGILLFFCLIFFGIYVGTETLSRPIPLVILLSFFSSTFFLVFFYGFSVLGEIYEKGLLRIASLLLTFFVIFLSFALVILFLFPITGINEISKQGSFFSMDYSRVFESEFLPYTASFLVFIFFFILLNVLFALGLMSLKLHFRYVKIIGIMHLISSILVILGIGLFGLFFTSILEAVILLKANKDLKQIFGNSES